MGAVKIGVVAGKDDVCEAHPGSVSGMDGPAGSCPRGVHAVLQGQVGEGDTCSCLEISEYPGSAGSADNGVVSFDRATCC